LKGGSSILFRPQPYICQFRLGIDILHVLDLLGLFSAFSWLMHI
jgi:hypothetical protein